jgi:Right handed beta helix region
VRVALARTVVGLALLLQISAAPSQDAETRVWRTPTDPADAVSSRGLDVRGGRCERWVAPGGDDGDAGSAGQPWATLEQAVERVPDDRCTVWFEDGVYVGHNEVERPFDTRTTFRAVHRYRAVLESTSEVLDIGGASSITFRGFELRHSGPGASGLVVYVDDPETDHITFRDNIFHDSYDNDLLKILSGPSAIVVKGNVFYNQGDGEEHIDVNGVTNVRIEDNIFFNDFARSGREDPGSTKHYVVVKDSNGNEDGRLGSGRVIIRRNVFMNWEGGFESFLVVGLDGKPYLEARDIRIENNLLIGNTGNEMDAAFSVYGARDVAFVNNTVVGDLPGREYAFRVDSKDENPPNRNILFANNIWADPTGTMEEFSDGEPSNTIDLVLDNNLYWNGGSRIPSGELVSPLSDDDRHVVRDPGLEADQSHLVVAFWTGSSFLSGESSIRAEFVRLVMAYGSIPATSRAVGRALPPLAPADDILGNDRDRRPDLGAFEAAR